MFEFSNMNKDDVKNSTISSLKQKVSTTFNSSIIKNQDLKFGALFAPNFSNYTEPMLVTTSDNIGTKIKFAIMANKHDTIGIDFAAMSINNLLSIGAKPLFLSNYIGVHQIEQQLIESLVNGIITGCKQSNTVLIGGETTEIPDMYLPGDYDLVTFGVGVVDKPKLLNPHNVKKGDLILGFYSSGLQLSGYQLLKEILEENEMKLSDRFPHTTESIIDIVLTPSRIYYEQVQKLLDKVEVHALKAVDEGLHSDIYKILPKEFDVEFYDFEIHNIFKTIMEMGNLTEEEMFKSFNCGVGMIVVIPEEEFDNIELTVEEKMAIIGKVV